MKSIKSFLLLVMSFSLLFSCAKEDVETFDDLDAVNFGAIVASDNCTANMNPLIYSTPVSTRQTCSIIYTYVSASTNIKPYARNVEVYAYWTDKSKVTYIVDAALVTIPAGKHLSNQVPILGPESGATLNYEKVTLAIASVRKADGSLDNCYNATEIEHSVNNCYNAGTNYKNGVEKQKNTGSPGYMGLPLPSDGHY
jgi:hypothetical protein